MKKLIPIILALFFSLSIDTHAHKQHTHQYLTIQGLKLCERTLMVNYPKMHDKLGTFEGDIGSSPFIVGKITTGAWREDEEDIVYGYCNAVIGDGSVISASHFWDPDDGDLATHNFEGHKNILGIPTYFSIGPYPNAYTKIMKYKDGGWTFVMDFIIKDLPETGGNLCSQQSATLTLTYNSLIDLYTNRNLYITHIRFAGSGWVDYATPLRLTQANLPQWNYNDLVDAITFEILGRMCHLVQDMSVPAHVHGDCHGVSEDGIRQDCYETWFGYNFGFNYASVYNNYGGFINPLISNNPLHYLMYTTAQMADHFGSNGPYEGDGDNILGGNSSSEEISFLNSVNIASLGNPTGLTNPLSQNQILSIRDKMIPQAIRATAGLLYWFASETGLISIPISTQGTLTQNEYWLDNTLNGNITIPPGVSLTIDSDATINLNGYSIISSGGNITIPAGATLTGAGAYLKDGAAIKCIYATVQLAVDNWSSGKTVELLSGTNNNTVIINGKNGIEIKGQGPYSTTFSGSITFQNSSNVYLHSLKVDGGSISLDNCSTFNLQSINYYQGSSALCLTNSTGQIYGSISLTSGAGVYCYGSNVSMVDDSDIKNEGIGIWSRSGSIAYATNITFCGNTWDIYTDATSWGYGDNSAFSGNPSATTYGNVTYNNYSICSSPKRSASSESLFSKDPAKDAFIIVNNKYHDLLKKINTENKNAVMVDYKKYTSEYKTVIDGFKSFIQVNPTSAFSKTSITAITHIYKTLADYEGMKNYVEDMVKNEKMSTLNSYAKKYLIDYYNYKNDYNSAIKVTDELVSDKSVDKDIAGYALYAKANIYHYTRDDKKSAKELYEKLVSDYSDDAVVELAKAKLKNMGFEIAKNDQPAKTVTKEDISFNTSNYPNPFNPTTNISFTLPQRSNVKLVVYDVLGKEVATLANSVYEAGKYDVTFNASSLPSGVYFYTLTTAQGTISKKMLLVK